jgi:hypothetical protein
MKAAVMARLFRVSYMVLVVWFLAGCAKDGKSTTVVVQPPNNPPPTCKSLFSVWTSTSDCEQFDFTDLEAGSEVSDYEYKAGDGAACGYKNNPNHSLTAQILVPMGTVDYDYQLKMKASLQMVGSCARYYQPGSSGNYVALIILVGCNEIEVCTTAGDCKTFN